MQIPASPSRLCAACVNQAAGVEAAPCGALMMLGRKDVITALNGFPVKKEP